MIKRILSIACLALLAPAVLAQPCPDKNVLYWQAFPPGGESDLSARHQQVVLKKKCPAVETVIQYKAGAGGALLWSQMNSMPGDGVTIMGVNLPHMVLQPMEGNVTYKTEDVTPVFWFHYTPDSLVVPEQSPIRSFADFIRAAKASPGKLNIGGSGLNSANHAAHERLNAAFGVKTDAGGMSIAITGAKVDIDDEGLIKISSSDLNQIEAARKWIAGIVEEAEVGKIYDGKVVNLVDFGAFVNFMGGKDGLVHVSEIKNERVEKVADVLSEGQDVKVKVLEIDPRGKVRLSMRVVDQETGEELPDTRPPREPREDRGPRGDRGDRGGRDDRGGRRRPGGDRGGRDDRGPRRDDRGGDRDRAPRNNGPDDDGHVPAFLRNDD